MLSKSEKLEQHSTWILERSIIYSFCMYILKIFNWLVNGMSLYFFQFQLLFITPEVKFLKTMQNTECNYFRTRYFAIYFKLEFRLSALKTAT